MRENKIRELRKDRRMTVVELANKAGISHPYLVRIEGGKRNLSLPIAEKLAAALEVSVTDVLGIDINRARVTGASGQMREDAEPYVPGPGEFAPTLDKKSVNIDRWRIKTNALDKVGIRDGSIVYVDISAEAVDAIKPLDCVIAQIYGDDAFEHVATVVRQFVPPSLLITNSSAENALPLDIDKGEAYVKGVIRGEYSPRRT